MSWQYWVVVLCAIYLEATTFTLGLWLNLLSSHLTTVPGPPNGMNGLICRSTEQIS